MPGLNRTGPLGRGPRTGWSLGRCRSRPDEEPGVSPPDNDRHPAWFWRREGGGPWGSRGRGGAGRRFRWVRRY